MVSAVVFPLHSFTLTIFIILLMFTTSNGDDVHDDHKYKNCSSSFISCGNLQNIGYPFWGYGRPKYCGHPALQLLCMEDEFPVLEIGDDDGTVYYLVNNSNSIEKSQMTIELHEYFPKTCPLHSFNKVFNKVFLLKEEIANITLFHNCPWLDMAGVHVPNCSITCWDNRTTSYYYLNNTLPTEPFRFCQTIEVPVLKDKLDQIYQETLYNVLDQWFEVDYQNFTACSHCQQSRGICGSHDKEFACFHKKSGQWKLIAGIAIPGAFFILIALNVGFWCCIKRKLYIPLLQSNKLLSVPMKPDLEIGSSFYGIPVLPYDELLKATNNFDESQELGDGGFGIVYYGKLRDGREVAVKRLYEKNYKRIEQFMNEIEILTRLRHPNLVALYGCTSRNSRELLLVYEYIPNGTVADHLYGERKGSETLSWDIRMKIAIETASALSYLHASEIIHRDVKTNNILLHNNFSVKVADFGLSRLFPCDATHVSTVPQGTPGYLDPQYHRNYQVTNKSDVYSFGVVLVELISSLPAVDISRQEDEINLYDYAMNKIQNGMLSELVDQNLGFESDFKVTRMMTLVAELAFRCLQQEKELRPTMDEVLEALEQIRSTDYEAIKAEDKNQSIAASKPSSLAAKNDTKPPDGNIQHPPSPNSVIVSWNSRSTASNTSS